MKKTSMLIIVILVMALAVPFTLERFPGFKYLSAKDVKKFDVSLIVNRYAASYRKLGRMINGELKDKDIDVPIDLESPAKVVYRWKDKTGSWQFSNVKPVGIESEAIEVVDKINNMDMDALKPVPREK